MALPMDEQRILAEIEHYLVRDDPALATRLASMDRQRERTRAQNQPDGSAAKRSPSARRTSSVRLRRRRAVVAAIALVLVGALIAAVTAVVRYPVRGGHADPAAAFEGSQQQPTTLQLTTMEAHAAVAPRILC